MRTSCALIVVFTILLGSCASLADPPITLESPPEGPDTPATGSPAVDDDGPGESPPGAAAERPGPVARVEIDTLYARSPDPANEDPGELLGIERRAVLAEVNRIRALHGLAAVAYDERYDEEVTAAALIIAANAAMTHYPDDSMIGYSSAGAAGAQTSNIHISFSTNATAEPSIAHVRNWLIDDGVPSLGHRRWILDPFLPSIAYGRVDGRPAVSSQWSYVGGSALKVVHDEDARLDAAHTPEFVAYPYGEYPVEYANPRWYWSFAVVADPSGRWANQAVDLSGARVSVHAGNRKLAVADIRGGNAGCGLPIALQWRVEGARTGERYSVVVDNVNVNGDARRYEYDVLIVE